MPRNVLRTTVRTIVHLKEILMIMSATFHKVQSLLDATMKMNTAITSKIQMLITSINAHKRKILQNYVTININV